MIRRLLTAALDAGTLSRTVLVLSRQLDNAHLLAASEEARADRAELRVAELEAETRDWAELSGELAAEQPAADALPDLTDAGDEDRAPPLSDAAREAAFQWGRAEDAIRRLQACEVELATMREAKLAADIRADVQRERAEQAERDRDTNARAAGAHIATINDLRKRLDDALRAVHKPAPAEQIPGVAGATPYAIWSAEYDAAEAARVPAPLAGKLEPDVCDACRRPTFDGERTGEAEAVLLCGRCRATAEAEEAARPPRIAPREVRYAAVMKVSAEIDAAADDPPPTRPSSATRTT